MRRGATGAPRAASPNGPAISHGDFSQSAIIMSDDERGAAYPGHHDHQEALLGQGALLSHYEALTGVPEAFFASEHVVRASALSRGKEAADAILGPGGDDYGYGGYGGYDVEKSAAPVTSRAAELWSAGGTAERPLRVICAGPAFQIGGVEQHTRSLARFLDPRRVQITKALVTGLGQCRQSAIPGIPFPVVPCTAAELSREAAECDVMLLWGEGFNDRLPKNRPFCVYLAHGESRWTRMCLERSDRVVDHVIAVSDRVKQRVCQGFPTTTILNGVDCSRLAQSRSREAVRAALGFEPADFVLGSVGRLTSEKRMDFLIDAVAALPRRFKLLLVGYGPRRAELLDRANERIPGRYAFVAAEDYLGDYYRSMDAFALASAHEGFGLVIAEAMFCGRPVIATDVGCVPEVLKDRISGLVVEPSPAAIAAAAQSLAEHRSWAAGLAAEGTAYAEAHLHASRMAREYEDLLARLVESGARTARSS